MKKFLWLIILGGIILSVTFAASLIPVIKNLSTEKYQIILQPSIHGNSSLDTSKETINIFNKRLKEYNVEGKVSHDFNNDLYEIIIYVNEFDEINVSEIAETLAKEGALEVIGGIEDGELIVSNYYIEDAEIVKSEYGNSYQVKAIFDDIGTKRLADRSIKLIGDQISIYLDDELLYVPDIDEQITNGELIVDIDLTYEEAKKLAENITKTPLGCEYNVISVSTYEKSLFRY